MSLYFYNRQPEHPSSAQIERVSTRQILKQIPQLPTFMRFMTSHAIMFLGVMIGGPFISVYMRQEAGFSIGTIGLITTVNMFAALIAMRVFGRIHDRFGIIGSMRLAVALPLLPVMWLWVDHPWQAFIIEVVSAVTWAAYNLGSFNLLLASTPDEHRPHYIAIHTTITSIVSAIGPLIGGWLLDVTGFVLVLSLSCIVRSFGLMFFFAFVREPKTNGTQMNTDNTD